MSSVNVHPYRPPEDIRRLVDRLESETAALVHPQRVIQRMRAERPAAARFNGWLADHLVGLAGTMVFFYFLCLVMSAWSLWQSAVDHNRGFDPFPYPFLFFILGGIMQSLFVPTMLTASNRAAERDRIKDEADHRAWSHLYDVNDEQLRLLREIADRLLPQQGSA